MPSYRVTMVIGALAAGVSPQQVLPAAKAAALEHSVVEASDLAVVAGEARITVRFAADETEIAQQIGRHVAARTAALASVSRWQLTERVGGRWQVR